MQTWDYGYQGELDTRLKALSQGSEPVPGFGEADGCLACLACGISR